MDVDAIRKAKFCVAIDAVNSVGGTIVPQLLRALGVARIVEINCDPTGNFAHQPEPLPENLVDTAAQVLKNGVDVCFVVDPDVDRLAIISEDATMFNEEYTLVAVARLHSGPYSREYGFQSLLLQGAAGCIGKIWRKNILHRP